MNKLIEEINGNQRMVILCTANAIDRSVDADYTPSKYEHVIQTGAANTDIRISDLNDYDGCEDNISHKNRRYGEFTAWYWAWKNIKTPYVGFCHYRRKWAISDDELDSLMDEGVDIIATNFDEVPAESIDTHYRINHYGYDWDVMYQILKERSPDFYEKAKFIFARKKFHSKSIGIFKKEVFDECCEWIFPIMEELEKRVAKKKDPAQYRDVAFVMERLLSLYFDIMVLEGKNCRISNIIMLGENENAYREESFLEEELFEKCRELMKEYRWNDMARYVYHAEEVKSEEHVLLNILYMTYRDERKELFSTFVDWSPLANDYDEILKFSKNRLMDIYNILLCKDEDSEKIFDELIEVHKCSKYFLAQTLPMCPNVDEEGMNYIASLYIGKNMFEEAFLILEKTLERYPDGAMTKEIISMIKSELDMH